MYDLCEENLYVELSPYTVEGQFYVSCIQCGGSLVWADDRSKVLKVGVDFYQKAFILQHKQDHTKRDAEDEQEI